MRTLATAVLVALSVGTAACGGASEDSSGQVPLAPPGAVAPGPPDAASLAPPGTPPGTPPGVLAPGPDDNDDIDGPLVASTATLERALYGLRLVLQWSVEANAFVGTVANTTEFTLCGVRVTVLLEDGSSFGPTKAIDLIPEATAKIEVPAQGAKFERWRARPEIAPCGIGG